MPRKRITVGERVGSLVMVAHVDGTKGKDKRYRTLCDCGRFFDVLGSSFRTKTSCPTCGRNRSAASRITHGAALKSGMEPLYKSWRAMRSRCNNPNTRTYKWYGAKGVKICDAWQNFANFRAWATQNGFQPGLTLDRLNTDVGYCPENCEFVTQSDNARRMKTKYTIIKKPDPFKYHFPIEALFGSA